MGKKVYGFYYDFADSGSRENWSVFYCPMELFETEELRKERYDFLHSKFTSDVAFHFFEKEIQDTLSEEFDEEYALDDEILEPDNEVEEISPEDDFVNAHEGATEPKDIYFFVDYEEDKIRGFDSVLPTVYLMKISEFDSGNVLISERSHPYVELPCHFINIDTATWQVDGLKSQVEKELEELGFQQSNKFDEAMNEWANL